MNVIKDDMLKESKYWKNPMFFSFFLTALFPTTLVWNSMKTIEFILGELSFFLIACFFLYAFLYTCKYKILVTSEKIILRTIFKSIEIQINEVSTYAYKRYRKTCFFQFTVFLKRGKVVLYTRYKDELKEILDRNKAEIQ